ncbi:MAG: HNH endonuclease [Nostoc sp.]
MKENQIEKFCDIENIKKILLTKNLVTIIDANDYEYISQWSWYASYARSDSPVYACRRPYGANGKTQTFRMHREILINRGINLKGKIVDHINGNTLDNRFSNLRVTDFTGNSRNRVKNRNSQNQYKGVQPAGNLAWMAKIEHDGIVEYLGTYGTQEEAAKAYNNAAVKVFGEFAKLNDLPSTIQMTQKLCCAICGKELYRSAKNPYCVNHKYIGRRKKAPRQDVPCIIEHPVARADTGETYKSVSEAARCIGVHRTAILSAIKNGHNCVGTKWEKVDCTSPVDTSLVGHPAIQKARLPQDTSPSGQLKTTPTPVASTESDSPTPNLLSKISEPSQTTLFSLSQYQISQSLLVLVQTFPWLVSEMDLLEFADNCFLRDLGSLNFSAHPHSSLKMSVASLAQMTELPSLKSSNRLQVWGIAAPGNLGMEIGTSPKTENGFSSWAITADVRATQPKQGLKSLAEIIGEGNAIVYRAAGGDRIYHEESPCLRSPNNSGTGAYKIREYQGETYIERPINATEAEQLMGWEVGSTAIGINQEGEEFFISQTQRIKMLGNGIVPAEITDILTAIKPMLERRLEVEVPHNMRFAYRQLRQKGMSHQEAMNILSPK